MIQIEEMIQSRVASKLEEYESKKAGTYRHTMNAEDGPLAPEVYTESMIDFKYPSTPVPRKWRFPRPAKFYLWFPGEPASPRYLEFCDVSRLHYLFGGRSVGMVHEVATMVD